VADEEELLSYRRPQLPRRLRLPALLVLVLAAGAAIAVHASPGGAHHRAAQDAPPVPAVPPTSASAAPWPSAPAACGGRTELPIVASVRPSRATGIELLVGSDQLRTVDFDSGRAAVVPDLRLRSNEYVQELLGSTYVVTDRCTTSGLAGQARVIRVAGHGSATVVAQLSDGTGILVDGPRAWRVRWPGPVARGSLAPLSSGPALRLPARFSPDAISDGVAVGTLSTSAIGPAPMLLVDALTGRVRARLGAGSVLTVARGVVLWTTGCDPTRPRPCALHHRRLAGGATRSYLLPRPPVGEGVLSRDGRLLAFPLMRAAQDARFEVDAAPPSDIAVLHLDSGRLDVVPGIEMPANTFPGLAFSADGRWLAIALSGGTRTRLLAWRPGLAHPYETTPIGGRLWGPPSITTLP